MQIITDIQNAPKEQLAITIGFFDGVHRGHRFLIENLKQIASEKGLKTAVLTFREHPRKILHSEFVPELLTTCEEKMALLSQTGLDYCILLDFTPEIQNLTAEEFIKDLLSNKLHSKVLLTGYDNRIGKGRVDGFEQYVMYGHEVGLLVQEAEEFLYKGKQVSSSEIRRLMDEGDISIANQLLGSTYKIEGKVVAGQQIGRTIGFPTANIYVSNTEKKLPQLGVYACWVLIDDDRYKGMLNIGLRPTLVPKNQRATIEVNIIDFNQEIYGEHIALEIVKKIRDERKFPNMQTLKEQIEIDKMHIIRILDNYTPFT
ncbi:MAG: ribF [Bacteroidetes bacterium]|nr:ribF [Bacteroidota bacterium]